jgi:ATP-binding cassette subfamily C (CFTR/MRP) protein 4
MCNKNFVALMYRMTQPLFLGGLIQYFAPDSTISHNMAVGYAACIVACTFISALMSHVHNMGVLHLGMKMRIGLCSLVYRKVRNIKHKHILPHILCSM